MGDLWLVMSRTGGDYEYTDWPIAWRWSEAEALACCAGLTAQIAKLAASVPPCPDLDDPDPMWDRYIAKEALARQKAEALGAGLDAKFFPVRLLAKAGPPNPSPQGSERSDEGSLPPDDHPTQATASNQAGKEE